MTAPAQVTSSSFDHNSELRGPSPKAFELLLVRRQETLTHNRHHQYLRVPERIKVTSKTKGSPKGVFIIKRPINVHNP
ncbi:hypothetical protein TNCV_4229961 [Trichonephila clavipes]|nr:hypothetical protein TNCV_4229961 [Trichonephila clavipes]